MKKLLFILFIIPMMEFGQYRYNWDDFWNRWLMEKKVIEMN